MKKILTGFLILLVAMSFAFAAGQNENASPNLIAAMNGTGSGNGTMAREQAMDRLRERIQSMNETLQERTQQREQKVEQKALKVQERLNNQVQNLRELSQLAENEQVKTKLNERADELEIMASDIVALEEKIMQRSGFKKFMVGGDKSNAGFLEQKMEMYQERIQQLEQLQLGEELDPLFKEQLQLMKEEHLRLKNLANDEKQKNGLFGWLFNK